MKRSTTGAVLVCIMLTSCGQDPSFIEKSFERPPGQDEIAADRIDSENASALKSKKFAFGKSVTPLVADYLFVLDNSVSMVKYSQKVANGLAAIPASSFPQSSKLAVMTTMVADNPLAASLVTHRDINRQDYTCIDKEPGFLELIDAKSFRRFRGCSGLRSDYAAKYALDACEEKWFEPFAVNNQGQRCFSAALQNSFAPVGCEAGLLALEQILIRNAGTSLFREGAAVNVIFVSDEQGGCTAAETRGQFSDAKKLVEMIKANSGASSVKFHGIIPLSVPDGVRKYSTEILATGGVAIAMDQDRADYRDVIQRIIESRADLTSSDFDLGESVREILRVEVNGILRNDFEFDARQTVRIPNLDPTQPSEIVVEYN